MVDLTKTTPGDRKSTTAEADGSYVKEDYSLNFVEAFFDDCSATAPIDKVLQIDTEIMLVDDPVKRVDNMTMAWVNWRRVSLPSLKCATAENTY